MEKFHDEGGREGFGLLRHWERIVLNIKPPATICRKHETGYRKFFPDLNLFTLKKILRKSSLTAIIQKLGAIFWNFF